MLQCQPLRGFKSGPESALGMGSMFATWVGSEVDGVFVVVTFFLSLPDLSGHPICYLDIIFIASSQ